MKVRSDDRREVTFVGPSPMRASTISTQQQPTNYTIRTGLAIEGLGFLPLQEASYVSAGVPQVGGQPFSGAGGAAHSLRYPPGRLPPVRAFCSLTVYDEAAYLVQNPIDRYRLGSSSSTLVPDPDGGITLHLSVAEPPEAANWLPIPDGRFTLTFRADWPSTPVGPHDWHLESVQRVDPQ